MRPRTTRARGRVMLLAGLALIGCHDATAPTEQSLDPGFVADSASAPAVAQPSITFYARADRQQTVKFSYADGADTTASELLRFTIPRRSLAALPDGTPITGHDSVPITITLVDRPHLIFEFQPAGLRFQPQHPAQLRFHLPHASADLNGDGVVDAADRALERRLAVWRQEHPGDPWVKLPSHADTRRRAISANIAGFTRYAIAF